MLFPDYYQLLNIGYPSNEEEIRAAYEKWGDVLGKESLNESDVRYPVRVDVEVGYRVLSSYRLKEAYDKEYQLYLASEDKDKYEIQEEWTNEQIADEYALVMNEIIPSLKRKKRKWKNEDGGHMNGCLTGLTRAAYLTAFALLCLKACS